jgi:hypothetical protein
MFNTSYKEATARRKAFPADKGRFHTVMIYRDAIMAVNALK